MMMMMTHMIKLNNQYTGTEKNKLMS